MSNRQNLAALFAGRQDCFGRYYLDDTKPEPGKKREGRGVSYPNSKYPDLKLTNDEWVAHFNGVYALGVVPVFVDGTCKWFSIDIDNYDLDHSELSKNIAVHQLPIVHCRSKSGGAHLYCLLSEPWPATKCIELAKKWCTTLGFDPKKTEIFPKQTKFDSPEAKGNWIIVPYFKAEKAEDFAIDGEGKKVSYKDFEAYCKSRVITPEEAEGFLVKKHEKIWSHDEILANSPPCILKLMEIKVKEGDGRNNTLSHLTWYYRKLDEFFETSDWKEKLDNFNTIYFDPPVTHRELTQVIRNHSNGKYKARCDVNPMQLHCNKAECLKRKFGIGADASFYGEIQVTSITKINTGDAPLWKVYIGGQYMTVDSDTLLSPRKFKIAILSAFNVVIESFKQQAHDAMIGPIIQGALVIEEADIISNSMKVYDCYKQWIGLVGNKSKDMASLLRGLPYINHDEKKIYARLQDIVLEYRRVHKENISDKEIYLYLKGHGFLAQDIKIGNLMCKILSYEITEGDMSWIPAKAEEGQF